MTKQERVTAVVTVILALVGGWFAMKLQAAASLERPLIQAMIGAVLLIAILAAVGSGLAVLFGGDRVDERDRLVAVRAQAIRGYLYLVLAYGVLAYAVFKGLGPLANGLFATVLTIEFVSGLVMLFLYRRAA